MSADDRGLPGPPLCEEVQKMRQWWLWLLVVGLAAMSWYFAYMQLVQGVPLGNHPAPDWVVWLLLVVLGVAAPLFFARIALTTRVHTDGLYVRFWPLLSWERFRWDELERVEAVEYHPVRDFGGWGIRTGVEGKVYSVSGKRAVRLILAGGSRLLIGSRQPERIVAAVSDAGGPAPTQS
jgi:hypothetical protein